MAVGEMGMRPADFYDLTPAEFVYARLGFFKRQNEAERKEWERERWSVWILSSIQQAPKDRKSMTEMFPFPWEKALAVGGGELTMSERKARIKKILGK